MWLCCFSYCFCSMHSLQSIICMHWTARWSAFAEMCITQPEHNAWNKDILFSQIGFALIPPSLHHFSWGKEMRSTSKILHITYLTLAVFRIPYYYHSLYCCHYVVCILYPTMQCTQYDLPFLVWGMNWKKYDSRV